MSSYTAYPEYRYSGVEWVDLIPCHWIVSRVKYLSTFQVGWTPSTKIGSNFIGNNFWANISDLTGKHIDETAKNISDDAAKQASMEITPHGSLLYSFKLSVGTVAFNSCDMYTNEAIASFLASDSKLPLSYLYYALPSFVIQNASTNIYGARILNQELIANALLLSIPYEEAEKIANFLDHETAKIDTLIEKQQQLIKLLKEKRQAVISHAVTKGLNPDAAMKDSGVEGLGEMPEGWAISAIRHLGECQNGINIGADSFGKGYPFVSYGDVYNNEVLPETVDGLVESTEMDRYKYSVEVGDVFFTRTSETLEEIGFASTCMSTVAEATFAGFLIRFRPRGEMLDPRYSAYFFRNQKLRQFFGGQMNIVTRASLSQDLLKTMTVPLPPLATQYEIVNQLDIVSEKFNELEMRAYELKTILVERRTALVSAAVTGKIDVRNWQPPTPQTTSKDV